MYSKRVAHYWADCPVTLFFKNGELIACRAKGGRLVLLKNR